MNPSILHKHQNHLIEIIDSPIQIGNSLSHPGKIMCRKCNIMIKWLGKREIDFINKNNIKDLDNLTFKEFTTLYNVMTNNPVKPEVTKIYLKTEYSEKDKVRSLGAKWDKEVKKWYINRDNPNIQKFEEWISISKLANL